MPVTNLFSIYTLTLPSTWLALIIAFVVAYVVIRIRFGKYPAEILSDALFYFIIVWKFSVILTDFKTVIHSPLSILYFHGGLIGFYLGLFAAGLRIVMEIRKKEFGFHQLTALFVGVIAIQSIYQVMMVVLNEGGLVAQIVTVLGFAAFALFVWVVIEKSPVWPVQLTVLFIGVHVFVAAFQEQGLTGTPVIATLIMSIFFGITLYQKRISEYEAEGQL
ncbi:hypothetical protein ACXYMX_00740 [Sporosarcina sp. CAU 1771]